MTNSTPISCIFREKIRHEIMGQCSGEANEKEMIMSRMGAFKRRKEEYGK